MTKMIYAQSGHHLHVSTITAEEFAQAVPTAKVDQYDTFYAVRNFDASGHTFMYIAKGYSGAGTSAKAARELHVWYAKSGKMWSSYGTNFETAINGAQRDGWLYA